MISQEEFFREESVIQSINEIKNDFHKSPIFYDPDSIEYLESESLTKNILNKLNAFYTPSCGNGFKIPYDTISERIAISLQIDDLVIRYLLKNGLSKISGFKLLTRTECDNLLEKFCL